jgi:hypothetical protein
VSLDTELTNSRETPLILALEYGFEYPKENADSILEIRERGSGNKISLKVNLQNDINDNSLFILPNSMVGKAVEFRISTIAKTPGEYTLNIKKAILTFG